MSSNNNNIIGGGLENLRQGKQPIQIPKGGEKSPFKKRKQPPPKTIDPRVLRQEQVLEQEQIENHYTIKFLNITITPTKVVKIPATPRSLERKLIEYTIEKHSVDPRYNIKIERVPYYFSDGETNGLKSLLRFPMLYFTTRNRMGETTRRPNFNGNGGVIKNGIVRNLSVTDATKETKKSAIEKYIYYINVINSELPEEQHITYINSIHADINGLSSMFSRVGNILDLLILICDDKLINFNNNESTFIKEDTFLKYRPRKDLSMPVFLDDFWRLMILERFNAVYKFFIEVGLELNKVHVPIVNETFQSYNDSLNMFEIDGLTINEETKRKYNYGYIAISASLQRRLQEKMLQKYGFNDKFSGFKILKCPTYSDDIGVFLRGFWHMNVKKKYLKYKIKYLLLEDIKKKLLLNNP